jgi:hypothetical protein
MFTLSGCSFHSSSVVEEDKHQVSLGGAVVIGGAANGSAGLLSGSSGTVKPWLKAPFTFLGDFSHISCI